jgi:hypothetical protein
MDVLSLDGAPLRAEFPTSDECLAAFSEWLADQQRDRSIISFSMFMSAKMGELYLHLKPIEN